MNIWHSPKPYNFKVKSTTPESISLSASLGLIVAEMGCSSCWIYGLVKSLGDSFIILIWGPTGGKTCDLNARLPQLTGGSMRCGGFDGGAATRLPLTEFEFLPRLATGWKPPWTGAPALLVNGEGKADSRGLGMVSLLIGGMPHSVLVLENLSSWIMCDSMWLTRDWVLMNTLPHRWHAIHWFCGLGRAWLIPCKCKAALLASQPDPAM